MKKHQLVGMGGVAALCGVACGESSRMSKSEYKDSVQQWETLKKANGGSYEYRAVFSSWVGYRGETTIRVENEQVVSRAYLGIMAVHDGEAFQTDTLERYTESASEIGTHELGAKPLTTDELSETCAKEDLVVNKKENTIYFEVQLNGVMSLCGVVPDNCADDCFVGVHIDSLRWLKDN